MDQKPSVMLDWSHFEDPHSRYEPSPLIATIIFIPDILKTVLSDATAEPPVDWCDRLASLNRTFGWSRWLDAKSLCLTVLRTPQVALRQSFKVDRAQALHPKDQNTLPSIQLKHAWYNDKVISVSVFLVCQVLRHWFSPATIVESTGLVSSW